MLLAVIFAHLWGVLQLIVLGSLGRTVRARTVLAAMAVGFFTCAPLAVLLQVTWIRIAASVWGVSYVGGLVDTASYTVDPFMEEILKALPLLLLLRLSAIRRQVTITDAVLIAAATGSGFGLAEALYALGGAPSVATPIEGGWIVGTGLALLVVPGMGTSLTAWLPSIVLDSFSTSNVTAVNLHLAWAALAGLAVGLVLRLRGSIRWIAAAALFLFIGLDHAAVNAEAKFAGRELVAVFRGLRTYLGLLPIVALAIAWGLDRRRWQRAANPYEPRLSLERSTDPRVLGTLRSALSRLPSSLISVWELARVRRAYGTARADGDSVTDLASIATDLRDVVDLRLASSETDSPWREDVAAWIAWLRRPIVLLWIALMLPPFLWFIVGGWPQTASLQRFMTGSIVWPFVLLLSTVAQAWLVWQLIAVQRAWSRIVALPSGDQAATVGLRALCGVGAVSLGGYGLARAFTGLSPSMTMLTFHASEAFGRASLDVAVLAGAGGISTVPPGAADAQVSKDPKALAAHNQMIRTLRAYEAAAKAAEASKAAAARAVEEAEAAAARAAQVGGDSVDGADPDSDAHTAAEAAKAYKAAAAKSAAAAKAVKIYAARTAAAARAYKAYKAAEAAAERMKPTAPPPPSVYEPPTDYEPAPSPNPLPPPPPPPVT